VESTVKVLLVDDGPDLEPMLREALGRRRIAILTVRSGAEAVERIERDPPHLVVCDIYMPDLDGYQICERVRAHPRRRDLPVLLMADVVDRSVLARAARVCASGVVRKPCLADELVSEIEGRLFGAPDASAGDDERDAPDLDDIMGSEGLLAALAAGPGVRCAVLMDLDGFVVERAGESSFDAEAIAALAYGVLETTARVGREIGHAALKAMTCEFDGALVLLVGAETSSALALILRDHTALDAARSRAARTIRLLSRASEMPAATFAR
jgi:CheY-like chemotaxis protein